MSGESKLFNTTHRTCEHCGLIAECRDRLHLCNCQDQVNCCSKCRAACRGDNSCGQEESRLIEPYYSEDGVTIYNADCRDVLPQLEPVDLVLTDPPYGIGISNKDLGGGRSTGIASTRMIYGDWDAKRVDSGIIQRLLKAGNQVVIWGGNYYADLLPPTSGWLVWDKRGGLPTRSFADVEIAWTSQQTASRIFTSRWDGFIRDNNEKRNGHPTQKPLALMKWCLGFAPEAKTILDPFMGSGTTLVAAKALGLKAIGIELEKKYCDIAVERLRQNSLFTSLNQPEDRKEFRQVSVWDELATLEPPG